MSRGSAGLRRLGVGNTTYPRVGSYVVVLLEALVNSFLPPL